MTVSLPSLVVLLLAVQSDADPVVSTSAPLNTEAQGYVLSIFSTLCGLNGSGRQPVAGLSRASTRMAGEAMHGHHEGAVYLELDRQLMKIVVEIMPGMAPTATGRFWVDTSGPYLVEQTEWEQAFGGGVLDTTNIMSSDLRPSLLNLEVQYQSNGQVGLSRRIPSVVSVV
jgi:hypothetical protein